jgi:hypothetical protein
MDDPPLPHTAIDRKQQPSQYASHCHCGNMDATSSLGEYARYIHQALCSPLATTLIQVLKRNRELATIPSLMAHLINTHLPYSTATE